MTAMLADLPCTALRDAILTYPGSSASVVTNALRLRAHAAW